MNRIIAWTGGALVGRVALPGSNAASGAIQRGRLKLFESQTPNIAHLASKFLIPEYRYLQLCYASSHTNSPALRVASRLNGRSASRLLLSTKSPRAGPSSPRLKTDSKTGSHADAANEPQETCPFGGAKPNDGSSENVRKALDAVDGTKDLQHADQLAEGGKVPAEGKLAEGKGGILQRFKDTYRQYGKILVVVHVATSAVWFGSFYYLAISGLDVIPLLRWLGAGEAVIRPFTLPGVGGAAVAYLLYKLATPVRYAVTIGGTQLAARLLRRRGHLPPISPDNTIRSLVRDGSSQMRERVKKQQRRRKGGNGNGGGSGGAGSAGGDSGQSRKV